MKIDGRKCLRGRPSQISRYREANHPELTLSRRVSNGSVKGIDESARPQPLTRPGCPGLESGGWWPRAAWRLRAATAFGGWFSYTFLPLHLLNGHSWSLKSDALSWKLPLAEGGDALSPPSKALQPGGKWGGHWRHGHSLVPGQPDRLLPRAGRGGKR